MNNMSHSAEFRKWQKLACAVCKNTEISIVEVKLNRIGKGLVRPDDWIPLTKLIKFTSLDSTRGIAFTNEKRFDCLSLFLFLFILHHIFSLFIIKS